MKKLPAKEHIFHSAGFLFPADPMRTEMLSLIELLNFSQLAMPYWSQWTPPSPDWASFLLNNSKNTKLPLLLQIWAWSSLCDPGIVPVWFQRAGLGIQAQVWPSKGIGTSDRENTIGEQEREVTLLGGPRRSAGAAKQQEQVCFSREGTPMCCAL